ncbi:hypothetical protein CCACVL1_02824 [Corchorus capsularis]|uniref:Uncharacterized protein n=1 Tax=Corchorus capsularis TaxID=210143 RepID=A0A1R3K5J6_COCAP|nr:hypothetical protein CCACVL1_02824 [Corchorus capsularis]
MERKGRVKSPEKPHKTEHEAVKIQQ